MSTDATESNCLIKALELSGKLSRVENMIVGVVALDLDTKLRGHVLEFTLGLNGFASMERDLVTHKNFSRSMIDKDGTTGEFLVFRFFAVGLG
jgi:hypothetical protein